MEWDSGCNSETDLVEYDIETLETPMYEVSLSDVFGDIQVFSVDGTGTAARVYANKDLLTDEHLIVFFHTYINESGHNWFHIDFGDGTVYMFSGSRNMFHHANIDEEGWVVGSANPTSDWNAWIFEDSILYRFDD